jgi:hypothetical protein
MRALGALLKLMPGGRCWEMGSDSIFLAWMKGIAEVLQEFDNKKTRLHHKIKSFDQLATHFLDHQKDYIPMRPQQMPSLSAVRNILKKAGYFVDFCVLSDAIRVIRWVNDPDAYLHTLAVGSRVGEPLRWWMDHDFCALLRACMPINTEWSHLEIEYRRKLT